MNTPLFNPILIGGTGRSGTTILKRVLSSHSKVISLRDELRVMIDPGGILDLISALSDHWSPYNADLAIHQFQGIMLDCGRSRTSFSINLEKLERKIFRNLGFAPRRYLGVGLAASFGYTFYHHRLNELLNDLYLGVSQGSWGGRNFQMRGTFFETEPRSRLTLEKLLNSFLNDLYGHLAQNDETHWLEDTPFNLLHAKDLLGLFPNMRLLHIYRDPRDVLTSYRNFAWGGNQVEMIARRLAGIYQRWFELRASLPQDCFLEVGLEQLSADPRAGLTKICNFVGLEFEESLMQTRLDKVHAGRWKRELPERDWFVIEQLLGKYASQLGY